MNALNKIDAFWPLVCRHSSKTHFCSLRMLWGFFLRKKTVWPNYQRYPLKVYQTRKYNKFDTIPIVFNYTKGKGFLLKSWRHTSDTFHGPKEPPRKKKLYLSTVIVFFMLLRFLRILNSYLGSWKNMVFCSLRRLKSISDFSALPPLFLVHQRKKILIEKLTSYISSTTYQDVHIEQYVIRK